MTGRGPGVARSAGNRACPHLSRPSPGLLDHHDPPWMCFEAKGCYTETIQNPDQQQDRT